MSLFGAEHHVAILILGEFVEELFLRDACTVFLFGTKFFGDVEEGHDRSMIDGVELHLVQDLLSGGQRLGNIFENLIHLLRRFEPFLLGVVEARLIEFLLQ